MTADGNNNKDARETAIARASAWNKANAARRNALRRQNRRDAKAAISEEEKKLEKHRKALIKRLGKEKGLKRLDYEKHRDAYKARAVKWAKENREKRLAISRRSAAKIRAADPEAARTKERAYYLKNRRALIDKQVDWQAAHPKSKEWLTANREKLEARSLALIAKRCGDIDASRCSKCGSERDIQMHHPDYDKPLEIIPLCGPCHREIHKA